nr:MAG TPA: hypothetical protein [Caudoviricetes sp.]
MKHYTKSVFVLIYRCKVVIIKGLRKLIIFGLA